MQRAKFQFLLGLFLWGAPNTLWAADQTFYFNGSHAKRQIVFSSRAPLEDFEGVASVVQGSVTLNEAKPGLGLSGTLTVPVSSMDTGLALRDEHMRSRDWLYEKQHPSIQFVLDAPVEHAIKKKKEGEWVGSVSGNLLCRGITRKIRVPVSLARRSKDLFVTGRFTLRLDDFGIRGPTAMRIIGLRVSPDVTVTLKLKGKAY